ncbi:hypothetical protein [Sphingomonas solaris]|uniref:Uncharacterized protein n=1 Tax=Alterirhizorhabdus solaris TaxID=2529389 RepID=A0A558RBC0_9SPHN|nr:hypothetical protein [Sphingomonas solaris]TVV76572.1 hypothetical protein FOY91_04075 [Sphingomonas solaris]
MARGKASGISLYKSDARVILGMVARGDRDHDIAAWFGVNQGRIAEVKSGEYGDLEMAPAHDLPPSGPPGIKGRRIREAIRKAFTLIEEGGESAMEAALTEIKAAAVKFDTNET